MIWQKVGQTVVKFEKCTIWLNYIHDLFVLVRFWGFTYLGRGKKDSEKVIRYQNDKGKLKVLEHH